MPEFQLLIILAVIAVVTLIALKVYTYRKARYLRELGYTFVYYYMKNCGDLNYYRNSDNHIAKRFKSSLDTLEANRGKWFLLGVSSRTKVNRLISFYKLADGLTKESSLSSLSVTILLIRRISLLKNKQNVLRKICER